MSRKAPVIALAEIKQADEYKMGLNVILDDGSLRQSVFTFFADELPLKAEQFVGLSEQEALELFMETDKRYLQKDLCHVSTTWRTV